MTKNIVEDHFPCRVKPLKMNRQYHFSLQGLAALSTAARHAAIATPVASTKIVILDRPLGPLQCLVQAFLQDATRVFCAYTANEGLLSVYDAASLKTTSALTVEAVATFPFESVVALCEVERIRHASHCLAVLTNPSRGKDPYGVNLSIYSAKNWVNPLHTVALQSPPRGTKVADTSMCDGGHETVVVSFGSVSIYVYSIQTGRIYRTVAFPAPSKHHSVYFGSSYPQICELKRHRGAELVIVARQKGILYFVDLNHKPNPDSSANDTSFWQFVSLFSHSEASQIAASVYDNQHTSICIDGFSLSNEDIVAPTLLRGDDTNTGGMMHQQQQKVVASLAFQIFLINPPKKAHLFASSGDGDDKKNVSPFASMGHVLRCFTIPQLSPRCQGGTWISVLSANRYLIYFADCSDAPLEITVAPSKNADPIGTLLSGPTKMCGLIASPKALALWLVKPTLLQ